MFLESGDESGAARRTDGGAVPDFEYLTQLSEPSWSSLISAYLTWFTLLLLVPLSHMTSEGAFDSLSLFFNTRSLCGGGGCLVNFEADEADAAERGAGLDGVQHRGQLLGALPRRCTAPPAGPSPAAAHPTSPSFIRGRRRSCSPSVHSFSSVCVSLYFLHSAASSVPDWLLVNFN